MAWLIVAAFCCAPRGAGAEASARRSAPPDSGAVMTLRPVEVEDTRPSPDQTLRVRPGFARAYDVTRARGRLRMVSDLLAGAVGVHVRQFGGAGSFSAVSIRGAPSSQVAVYLDGVPL